MRWHANANDIAVGYCLVTHYDKQGRPCKQEYFDRGNRLLSRQRLGPNGETLVAEEWHENGGLYIRHAVAAGYCYKYTPEGAPCESKWFDSKGCLRVYKRYSPWTGDVIELKYF